MSSGSDAGRQLPLALRYPPDQRLETFVAPPPGAIAQLRSFAEGAGADWLYLQGPMGSGKSHLALAACAASEVAGRPAAYLPLQAASGRMRAALDAIEGNALIALDGLQHVAGKRDDEVALFDFHNLAGSTGIAVLYTATGTPDGLPLVLPDLRSRLARCTRVSLALLDDSGRARVLRERARRRGLVLEQAALDWLLKRVGRDLGGLTALLDSLDRVSLATQRKLTVPFLRQVLGTRPPG